MLPNSHVSSNLHASKTRGKIYSLMPPRLVLNGREGRKEKSWKMGRKEGRVSPSEDKARGGGGSGVPKISLPLRYPYSGRFTTLVL